MSYPPKSKTQLITFKDWYECQRLKDISIINQDLIRLGLAKSKNVIYHWRQGITNPPPPTVTAINEYAKTFAVKTGFNPFNDVPISIIFTAGLSAKN